MIKSVFAATAALSMSAGAALAGHTSTWKPMLVGLAPITMVLQQISP